MSQMQVRPLEIDGALSFAPPVFCDDRGQFASPFQADAFVDARGGPLFTVRDVSVNRSAAGVLRGVHYTATPPGRTKFVHCAAGRVVDVLVDLRVGSPTFCRTATEELSGDNCRALYIPTGVGHAVYATADDTVVVYLMSNGYVPADELVVSPLDPALDLPFPTDPAPLLSERDTAAPTFAEALARGLLPTYAVCVEADRTA